MKHARLLHLLCWLLGAGCLQASGTGRAPRSEDEAPVNEGTDAATADRDGASGGDGPRDAGEPAEPVDGAIRPDAGQAPTPIEPSGRRPLPEAVRTRQAVSYSGYRRGQNPEWQIYPSEEQIREDLTLLVQGGFGLIRLFDSGPHAERVLKVISEQGFDLQVALGIWIDGSKAEQDSVNREDLERGVALANAHADIVATVGVGNETLGYDSQVLTPPGDLAEYMAEVRRRVPQPVCTDDLFAPFLLERGEGFDDRDVLRVIESADFLSVHVYPFVDASWNAWEWKQVNVPERDRARAMMSAALAYVKDVVQKVKERSLAHGIEIPIVIGETGWKSKTPFSPNDPEAPAARVVEYYLAHPVNQAWMLEDLERWVHGADRDERSPEAVYVFEAFDEPWKGQDDHWGLFDVDRKAKYALWSRVPTLRPAGAPVPEAHDAVYYPAP